ncbi:MAG TPA: site-specific integrase [Geminicoccus sp.]|jgi:integrase|uniref:tyrosine-type recombinase/integrase n=1 Tax=Geminicoccus sp. TaxID=2024832 RepID=UPI002E343304|nr:site-specific integrase [Geminicoccus sp.]HEX2526176.1 site-specific integrase [Geminicoccus sp.]
MAFSTQREVDRLAAPPDSSDALIADSAVRGLYVRIQGDRRMWVVRYGEKRRKMVIGEVAAISLKDARTQASKIMTQVRDGADPLQERKARADAPKKLTVGELALRFLSQYAERHHSRRTLIETRRAMNVHISSLHDMDVDTVNRRHIADLLNRLVGSSGPITANRVRGMASKLFSWAMEQGLADANPVVGTARPAPERTRERVLSNDEIRAIWDATEGGGDYYKIVRLLLLTGQRRDEVAGMRWSEISADGTTWTIPSERAKNAKKHDVPLSEQVQNLLAIVERRGGRDYVFGRGNGGYCGYSRSKAALDRQIAAIRAEQRLGRPLEPSERPLENDALPAWVLHDLRRTVNTNMQEVEDPHIVDAVFNHTGSAKEGVHKHYNFARYKAQKQDALQRWADHVGRIVMSQRVDSVVQMQGMR